MGEEGKAGAQGHTESAAQTQQQTTGETKTAGDQGKGTPEVKAGGETKTGEQTTQQTPKAAEQGKETPGKDGEKPKAPEKYTLTVPENGKPYVDEKVLAQVEKLAKANGWSNDDAQAQLNDHIETMRALSTSYLDETKADKQYGGDTLEETTKLARLAIAKIRPEGHPYREPFLQFLNRFAGENNINVVAFLADVGRHFAEDSPAIGKGAGGKEKTAEDVLYPSKPAA